MFVHKIQAVAASLCQQHARLNLLDKCFGVPQGINVSLQPIKYPHTELGDAGSVILQVITFTS